ncbi:plasma membrane H+-transporting ATPase, partial [Rhizoctonia solani 123E]
MRLHIFQCTEEGLTETEAHRRLELLGPNKLESKEENAFLQVMEGSTLVAIALSNGGGRAPDWPDFVGIVLLINSAIGFCEEPHAGNAAKTFMDSLAPKWSEIESAILVPGDMVAFKTGNVVSADCRLTEAINVSIDQAAFTGESSSEQEGRGEAEGNVISTGANTLFGRAASLVGQNDDTTGHMLKILAQIGSFCFVSIGISVIIEIVILYPRFHYSYRRGLDTILVLLIGGIPIVMPTVLSVTMAVGAQQLAKHKATVIRITAIEELAGVTILCLDKTGNLTTNKLTIDRDLVKTYGPFSPQDVIPLAAYASRTKNQDAIDQSVVGTLNDPTRARAGIKLLDFKPFNPVDKRTEITYHEESSGKLKRATKGMNGIIIELCSRNKTEKVESQLEADVTEFAGRGFRALAVAYEEPDHDNFEGDGNGFKLIGLLAIFDPPFTGDQLAIAKETGRRLGLGDHMYPAKVLKDGPPPRGKHISLDDMINADGFAGVFPEHYPVSTIVHAIHGSRQIFRCMRNYAIYACAVTIRIIVSFAILAFAYQFDFPPLLVLIIALLNDGAIMTLPVDRVLPSNTPGAWDLAEIFAFTVAHGLYLTLSTIVLVIAILETNFFENKFAVAIESEVDANCPKDHNNPQLHVIVHLQAAMTSQALTFITRSHGFFFIEHPSTALLGAFAIAQLVSSIAAY